MILLSINYSFEMFFAIIINFVGFGIDLNLIKLNFESNLENNFIYCKKFSSFNLFF